MKDLSLMKSERELSEEREELIEKLKKEITKLYDDMKENNREHERETEALLEDHEMEVEDALKTGREILSLVEERFGRRVSEEIELDLKCRRA